MLGSRWGNHSCSVSKLFLIFFALLFLLAGVLLLVVHQPFIEQASSALAGYQARHPAVVDAGHAARLTHLSAVIGMAGAGVLLLLCLNDRFRKIVAPMLPLCLVGLFLTALAAIYVYAFQDSKFLWQLHREDGFLETLTALALIISAVLFARSAWIARKLLVGKRTAGSV